MVEATIAVPITPLVKVVPEGHVKVIVEAEDEESHTFQFEHSCAVEAVLRPLATAWATAHGVPPECVAFEVDGGDAGAPNDVRVNLDHTPAALGWPAGTTVRVRAVPIDEEYAEGGGGGNREETASQEAALAAPLAPAALAARSGQPAQDAAQPAQVSTAHTDEAPAQPPLKRAKTASKTAETAPEPKAKAKAKTAPEPKAKAKVKAAPAPAPADGTVPGDDERIKYEPNPKKEGSSAHTRYGKYMKAKTPKEAKALGASKADIGYDFQKGFLKRAR